MGTALSIVNLSAWSCQQLWYAWSWIIVTYYNMSDYVQEKEAFCKGTIKDLLWSDTVTLPIAMFIYEI
jgi:hypothetical protein